MFTKYRIPGQMRKISYFNPKRRDAVPGCIEIQNRCKIIFLPFFFEKGKVGHCTDSISNP